MEKYRYLFQMFNFLDFLSKKLKNTTLFIAISSKWLTVTWYSEFSVKITPPFKYIIKVNTKHQSCHQEKTFYHGLTTKTYTQSIYFF